MDEVRFNDWKESVTILNKNADAIIEDREEIYDWMASTIKKAFSSAGNPLPSIHVNGRGTEISCTWGDKIKLHITKSLVDELMMEFDFTRRLDGDGGWIKEIVFYPFGRD